MLLLLRFTGHKKLASVLGLLTTIAGLALGVVTGNHLLLITGCLSLVLSLVRSRHQRQAGSAAAS